MGAAVGFFKSGAQRVLGLTVAIQDARLWMDLTRRRIGSYNALLHDFQVETSTTLRSIGFRKWASFWHLGRQMIDLQTRLMLEQVYSDMGKPWSDLITGFGPLARIGKVPIDSAARYRAKRRDEIEAISSLITKRTLQWTRERSRRRRTRRRVRRHQARRGIHG